MTVAFYGRIKNLRDQKKFNVMSKLKMSEEAEPVQKLKDRHDYIRQYLTKKKCSVISKDHILKGFILKSVPRK